MSVRFGDIKEPESMRLYLRQSINRQEGKIYSHYTNIESVLNIFNNGCIWLSDYNQMNDLFERELLNQQNYDGRLFFLSFSKADENLAMYKMYGNEESALILRIPHETMKEIITFSCHGEMAGGIDDDGDLPSYKRKVHIVKDGVATEETVYASLYCADIAYVDPYSSALSLDGDRNNQIISPLKTKELAGLVKYSCWDYEQEIRLSGELVETSSPTDRIALKLPNDIVKKVHIILGPEFDEGKYYDQLIELRKLGIVCNNSIFDNMIRIKQKGRNMFGLDHYMDSYRNKKYGGRDPWGDPFTVTIKGFKRGEMVWVWENTICNGEKNVEIEEGLKTAINDDLVGHYEISKKLYVFEEDPKAYLSYSYSGSIQLVANKILISFNTGHVCSYVYGGSGADSYCFTGSARMGMNLLAILEIIP